MALKYSDKPQLRYGAKQPDNWRSRFPGNARAMNSAPITATYPVLLWDPAGKAAWGIHHLNSWHEVEVMKDAGNRSSLRMNGKLIGNPVAWSSS